MLLNMADFGKCWKSLQTFLKGLLYGCKWISNCLRDYLNGFRVNSLGSELGGFWAKSLGYSPWFWAKSLGYSPWFWTWRILASVGNRSKPSWKDSYMVANGFLIACGTIWMDFGWIRWGPNLADFEQKAWAIAHAFEHGGFWQVLEIAPNLPERTPVWLQMDF